MMPRGDAAARSNLRDAARDTFVYALPMTEIANVRDKVFSAGIPAGQFRCLHGLATPADRFVTTPNADTIYASAFIDLRGGPAELKLPDLGDQYGSLALMSMFSDNFAILGSRTTGQRAARFTLVGPQDSAPSNALRSPTPWVWALARVLVTGEQDAQAALSLLNAFDCEAAPSGGYAAGADRTGNWRAWLSAANLLLMENPPLATDMRMQGRMSALGVGTPDFDPQRWDESEESQIAAGIADGTAACASKGFGGRRVGDWIYPAANTGNFFQDYLTRAQIAVSGLAALPPYEATYLAALSSTGALFEGNGPWRIRFSPHNLPPAEAFWSLTMYEADPNGGFFLTDNIIDRYSISDRTPNIRFEKDGSLEFIIAREDPGGDRRSNWLPAPKRGPFLPLLRVYLPQKTVLDQTYAPPSIELVTI